MHPPTPTPTLIPNSELNDTDFCTYSLEGYSSNCPTLKHDKVVNCSANSFGQHSAQPACVYYCAHLLPVSDHTFCFKIGLSPHYSKWYSTISPTKTGPDSLLPGYKAVQSYLNENRGTPKKLKAMLENPTFDMSGIFGAQLLTAMINAELWTRYAFTEGNLSTKPAKSPLYDIIWTPNRNKTLCDPYNVYPTSNGLPVTLGNILEISDMVIGNIQEQTLYDMINPFIGWTGWTNQNTPSYLTHILVSFNEGFENCKRGPKAICWTLV
jgi:hypothetical protein